MHVVNRAANLEPLFSRLCVSAVYNQKPFWQVFRNHQQEISSLKIEEKALLFRTLSADLFDKFEMIKSGKSEYILCLRNALGLADFPVKDLGNVVKKAQLRADEFDPEWLTPEISSFLTSEELESPEWCKERVDYLSIELPQHSEGISLTNLLKSPGYEGVKGYILDNSEDLHHLKDAYRQYVQVHFANKFSDHRPYSLFLDLKLLNSESFFKSNEFKSMRDQGLRERLEENQLSNLSAYLAYYEREVSNPLSFKEVEKIALRSMAPHAENAALEALRSGTERGFKQARLIMNTMMPASFGGSEEVKKAVISGVVKNFRLFESSVLAVSLLEQFSSREVREFVGRLEKLAPGITFNVSLYNLVQKADTQDLFDIGMPCPVSLVSQRGLITRLAQRQEEEKAYELALAVYSGIEAYVDTIPELQSLAEDLCARCHDYCRKKSAT